MQVLHGDWFRVMISNVANGHGIDVVDIDEFKKMVYDRIDLSKRFHVDEIEYASQFKEPWKHLAGCFAAKESVLKALGTGWSQGVQFLDIELTHETQGGPRIVLSGVCAEKAAALSFDGWLVSLTYSSNLAFASVIALATSPPR